MNVSLYQAAAALNATARWQDVIATNLASSWIPGFKKQEVSFAAVQTGLRPTGAEGPAATGAAVVLPKPMVSTSFQPGELRFTGEATDVAIEGPGLLEVQLPNGQTAFTRGGSLRVTPAGQLVTKQGFAVLTDNGPVQLDPKNPAPLTILPNGEVSQGMDRKGQLRLVEFPDPRLLTPAGSGCFLNPDPTVIPQPAGASVVRQGFIESANTSSILEMSSLLEAVRLFEANQRVIEMQDQRLGHVITELGNPT